MAIETATVVGKEGESWMGDHPLDSVIDSEDVLDVETDGLPEPEVGEVYIQNLKDNEYKLMSLPVYDAGGGLGYVLLKDIREVEDNAEE